MDHAVIRSATVPADAPAGPRRAFDGVLCFGGEDWWYHNRGHYDMRVMRALSGDVPVLYVNSLGMRVPRPSEGRMFVRRVHRKLRSLGRGLHRIDERFAVLSPPSIPGRAMRAAGPVTAMTIRRALRRLGIRRPLAWVACPTAADLLPAIPHAGLVYQRTDRYEAFTDVDADAIAARDRSLKRDADLVVYCSGAFMEDDAEGLDHAVLVDHGVDAARFEAADAAGREPVDVAGLPRPRVGFVGAIDAHTFDPELFLEVSRRVPGASFVLVGGCTLPEGWCRRPNVHLLGQRRPEQVADYMAACDVLIMPWRRSPWIDACHPVKLKEYLATGRPVVTTPFRELSRYPGLVATAEDGAGFAAMIERALEIEYDPQPGRARVAGQTWADRAADLRRHLAQRGLVVEAADADAGDGAADALRRRRWAGLVAGRVRPAVPRRTDGTAAALMEDKPSAGDPDARRLARAVERGGPQGPRVAPATAGADHADQADGATRGAPPDASPGGATTEEGSPVRLRLHAATPVRAQELPEGDLPLACAIVLAGGLRPSPLQEVLDRSPIDWWIAPDGSVLETWADRIRTATAGMRSPLPIRVLATPAMPAPWPSTVPGTSIERDPHPYRGPAGVVRDVAQALPADRHVLVVEGARHLDASLAPMIADHLASGAAITVGRNPDRSPAGVYCIRRDALDAVPTAGFCDLKEQLLPRLRAAGRLVLVHDLEGRGAMPLRTRLELIEAARVARHAAPPGGPVAIGRMPGPSALRVVCRGAMVGPEADVLDSIVMPGAYVGAGSTVIRSIIGPGTVVPADVRIVDCVHHAGRVLDEGPGLFRAA